MGEAEQQSFEKAASQCVASRERESSQRKVFVEELVRGLFQPRDIVGMRGQHGGSLVRGEGRQQVGGVGPEHFWLEQERGRGRCWDRIR